MSGPSPPPAPRSTDRFDIPSLDGLRAISFLIVFVSHAGFQTIIPGGFGVTVFFFLSGYLITTLMRLEWEQRGSVSLKLFYLRRGLRILPPFYTVLFAATALTLLGVLAGPLLPAPLAATALHFNNYWTIAHGADGIPAGTGVYWSLAVEEHFYLVFPWIFLALHRALRSAGARAAVLWGACALILAWRCLLVLHFHVIEDRTYMASDTRFDSILFGCALAIWGNPMLDRTRVAPAMWKWLWLPAGLGLLLFTFLFRDPRFRETARYTLQGLALTPLFIAAIRYPAWGPFRLLNLRPVRYVGVLSYSLYLLHHVVLGVLQHRTRAPVWITGTLGLAICLVLSSAIYRWIEKPAARLRKQLSRVSHLEEEERVAEPASPAPTP